MCRTRRACSTCRFTFQQARMNSVVADEDPAVKRIVLDEKYDQLDLSQLPTGVHGSLVSEHPILSEGAHGGRQM